MRTLLILFLLIASGLCGLSQPVNTDPSQGLINIPLPRTPESGAFEKYWNAPVNELTGAVDISIPIYTVKSRFLQVPVTLSYQPGIKVSQEASWVGLGWDLIAGGRITMETKGMLDFDPTSALYSTVNLANGLSKLYHRRGDTGSLGVLTYAYVCRASDCADTVDPENAQAMVDMVNFGAGEPDVFRANFMGHSLKFYFNKITGQMNWLGEKSLMMVTPTFTGGRISSFTIVDNLGNTYTFGQTETTSVTLPSNSLTAVTSNTAWLLTRVQHPSGDYIQFNYANSGNSYPAFNWNASVSILAKDNTGGGIPGLSTVTTNYQALQNVVYQTPYYLTSIQTANTEVDFSLGSRTDIYGAGSKRLDQIAVKDRITNTVTKTVSFHYSYFTASANPCSSSLGNWPYIDVDKGSYLACYNVRLRLDSLHLDDATLAAPYKFHYTPGVIDKYSFSQDHWGFYNGVLNNAAGCSPENLIPRTGLSDYLQISGMESQYAYSRDCSPNNMAIMTLDSMIYPTGGSIAFAFEPHQSNGVGSGVAITGGGLRVRDIKNYESGVLSGSVHYDYYEGLFYGSIQYTNHQSKMGSCTNEGTWEQYVISSYGAYNDNDLLVAYPYVVITQKDKFGNPNGSLKKTFNLPVPSGEHSNSGAGILTEPANYPNQPGNVNTTEFLYPLGMGIPPTPICNLDGKLIEEQYMDNSSNVLKSVNYYYHQAEFTDSFYDARAFNNKVGDISSTECLATGNFEDFNTDGNRSIIVFLSPGKSFYTLTDSVVETIYNGIKSIRNKKAYLYNSMFQQEYETDYNSDGTQTVTHTQTSGTLTPLHPLSPLGNYFVLTMQGQHIYDLPVEQTTIHRGVAGDSMVVGSRFNVYQGSLLQQVFSLETRHPITWRSDFQPIYWNYAGYPGNATASWDSLRPDSRYVSYNIADYSPVGLIWGLHTLAGNTAYIWDETYNYLLAQCTNADSSNVAFTSFESGAKGRWAYDSTNIVQDNSAPTGARAYNIAAGNITRAGLSSSTKYIVSYWTKATSSCTISGTVSVVQGKTINSWTYFEHTVSGTTCVTLSGSAEIDELRLYPSTAQMTSYTYAPLIGITTQCDLANRISYYFYDGIGRLKSIKDQDGNIIKTFQYHFKGMPVPAF